VWECRDWGRGREGREGGESSFPEKERKRVLKFSEYEWIKPRNIRQDRLRSGRKLWLMRMMLKRHREVFIEGKREKERERSVY